MTGYHIFYQSMDEDRWEPLNHLTLLASILFWKKNFGKIKLICNKKYLDYICKYNLDKLYDDINVELFNNIPYLDYLPKYWSFCKIFAADYISDYEEEFVIFDTDLWIHNKLPIDNTYNFIGYHLESPKTSSPQNPYIDPSHFLDNEDIQLLDWNPLPVNCAFMYFNSTALVKEWYKWSVKIIERNKDKPKNTGSSDTIFIEQRILPSICSILGMKWGTLIPNVYFPHIPSDAAGSEWSPKIGYNEENEYISWNVKHVWGLKKMYDKYEIREMVFSTLCGSLNQFFPKWEIDNTNLYKDCTNLLNLE